MIYQETDKIPISHIWDIEAEHHQARHNWNSIKYIVFQHDSDKQFEKKRI